MTKLYLLKLRRSIGLLTGTVVLSSTALMAHAGNMYIYKDSKGEVLLTNVTPSNNFKNYDKKVKVTYYPSSTAAKSSAATLSSASKYKGYGTPSRNANRNAYDDYIHDSASRHGVDPALMKAMMHTESAFNPRARSPVGAQGLMQLMPATARRFNVSNPWNPAENIEGAAKYIAWLSKRFDGRIEHVVAGYNAGEGNVDKYGGIPPFKETRGYVKKVLGRYNTLYRGNTGMANIATAITKVDATVPVRRAKFLPASTTYGTNDNSYANSAFEALR